MNVDLKINEIKQNIVENALFNIEISRDALISGSSQIRAIYKMLLLSTMLEWECFLGNMTQKDILALNINKRSGTPRSSFDFARGTITIPNYLFDTSSFKDKELITKILSFLDSFPNTSSEMKNDGGYYQMPFRIYKDHLVSQIALNSTQYNTPTFLEKRCINNIDEYNNYEKSCSKSLQDSFEFLLKNPSLFNFIKLIQHSPLDEEDPCDSILIKNIIQEELYIKNYVFERFIAIPGIPTPWNQMDVKYTYNKTNGTIPDHGKKILSIIKIPISTIISDNIKYIVEFTKQTELHAKSEKLISDQSKIDFEVFKMTDPKYLSHSFDIKDLEDKIKDLSDELSRKKLSHKVIVNNAKKSIRGKVTRAVTKEVGFDKDKLSNAKRNITNLIKCY